MEERWRRDLMAFMVMERRQQDLLALTRIDGLLDLVLALKYEGEDGSALTRRQLKMMRKMMGRQRGEI